LNDAAYDDLTGPDIAWRALAANGGREEREIKTGEQG